LCINYEEVDTEAESPKLRDAPERKRRAGSCFCNRFVIDDQGTIYMSLRDLTLTLIILFDIFLIVMLVRGCNNGQAVCDETHWPAISDLLKSTYNTRFFCIISTTTCYVAMSGNIRAFHHFLARASLQNDILTYIGTAAFIAMPLIGFFDEDNFKIIHYSLAAITFVGFGVYVIWLNWILSSNKLKFTPEQQEAIVWQGKLTVITIAVAIVGNICLPEAYPGHPWGQWTEWIYTFCLLNYFCLLSLCNDYYTSVTNLAQFD